MLSILWSMTAWFSELIQGANYWYNLYNAAICKTWCMGDGCPQSVSIFVAFQYVWLQNYNISRDALTAISPVILPWPLSWCFQTAPPLFPAQRSVFQQELCNLRKWRCNCSLHFLLSSFIENPPESSVLDCWLSLTHLCNTAAIDFWSEFSVLSIPAISPGCSSLGSTETLPLKAGYHSIAVAPISSAPFQTVRNYFGHLLPYRFDPSMFQIPSADQLLLNLSNPVKCPQCTRLLTFVSHQPHVLHCTTSCPNLLSLTLSSARLPTYRFC